jgi:PEP-CTERM motif
MSRRSVLGVLGFCLALFFSARPAVADSIDGVTFTLTSAADQTGTSGSILSWTFSLENDNTDDIALTVNLVVNQGDTNAGTADSSVLTPLLLNPSPGPGNTGTGTLFAFDLLGAPGSTTLGTYDLTVDLLLSGTQIDFTGTYSATIAPAAPVPEPGTLVLIAVGLVTVVLGRKFF